LAASASRPLLWRRATDAGRGLQLYRSWPAPLEGQAGRRACVDELGEPERDKASPPHRGTRCRLRFAQQAAFGSSEDDSGIAGGRARLPRSSSLRSLRRGVTSRRRLGESSPSTLTRVTLAGVHVERAAHVKREVVAADQVTVRHSSRPSTSAPMMRATPRPAKRPASTRIKRPTERLLAE
jgi:hypothetical protein